MPIGLSSIIQHIILHGLTHRGELPPINYKNIEFVGNMGPDPLNVKIIFHYQKIAYNMNALRRLHAWWSMPAGRTSDSMTVPT